jgi:hypothetical protein
MRAASNMRLRSATARFGSVSHTASAPLVSRRLYAVPLPSFNFLGGGE